MATLYEAYFDGDIDIPGDLDAFLRNRNLFVNYSLTPRHFKWALTNFVPEVAIHSREQDRRIVREHYDRGNDFFGWFLGERMVYTSGFFQNPAEETCEQAQDNKMNLVAQKLQLKPGERLLDIGCGWGTLVRHTAKYYGTDSTGVTIAERQTEFGNQRIQDWGLEKQARVLCKDYREIPKQKFDKIVSLEMVEHVGVKNLVSFYEQVRDLLTDDGLFLLQWTGLRRGLRPEDLIWGLFMNKYIFPGADASLCPSPMLKAMEKAGWETHSVENISIHYSWTIKKWHENWLSNREAVIAAYGERWFRIWHFFLAWSVIIAEQGNAACFQVVLNKNLDHYDRTRWVKSKAAILGDRAESFEAPAAQAAE
ncbi:MAG: class I SAM-dependent methyltransferase [Polyangiaceae bacterium]|nr:class I SAM-dependent methyltransferase [Polyangiaceae bacterium]MCW5789308.1 class I SAM-dependent methyltransferase [Polyangiaceae bacterium]